MSNTTPASSPSATRTSSRTVAAVTDSLNADTTHGTTTVDDSVVAKIAGIAAREVPGVHDLGGGAARAIGALRTRINQADQAQGISVEVGETQAAVDVIVVAEYPIPLHHVADGIRTAVTTAIETLVGLEVTEVNVTIADVHIPSDDDSADEAPRVQ
ncbi:Asp23/Gls24 family envelope stress response protein [uncultured Amnibacterium sp.]|uniref:Asp23/Gls24 family envelope stress response protein n=1 Tax=uncultured Amnibacterium sp. TaxID=1631851 RepID=UPI0035C9FEE1